MAVMRSERIGGLRIFIERDKRGRVIKSVYLNYILVARFDPEQEQEYLDYTKEENERYE